MLLAILLDTFPPGEDDKEPPPLSWHPTTIKMELEQHFGIQLPKLSLDKIMAAVLIRTTDRFFQEPSVFIALANVLCGDDFEPDEFDPADALECAWAVTEAFLLNPPDDEDPEPFSDDVRTYIGFALREEGFVTPPGILKIAIGADFTANVQEFADDPEMFEGIYQAQQAKADEIDEIVKNQLADLTSQLERLPLQIGKTANMVARLRQAMQPQ